MEPARQAANRTLSLIIAIYFNADSLPLLFVELGKFETALSALGLNLELIFVDDGLNPYRTMCFTIAAKLAKRRGAEIETLAPGPGEVPHAKVVEAATPPKAKVQRPMNRR